MAETYSVRYRMRLIGPLAAQCAFTLAFAIGEAPLLAPLLLLSRLLIVLGAGVGTVRSFLDSQAPHTCLRVTSAPKSTLRPSSVGQVARRPTHFFPFPAFLSPTRQSLEQNVNPHFLQFGKLTPSAPQTPQTTCFVSAEAISAAARVGSMGAILRFSSGSKGRRRRGVDAPEPEGGDVLDVGKVGNCGEDAIVRKTGGTRCGGKSSDRWAT
jgi:hypothetical protein